MKKHGHPRFYKLLDEISDLHSRKNHDYAGKQDPLANLKACERIKISCPKCKHTFPMPAWIGCIVRMIDKWSRILNFVEQGELKVKRESLKDALQDNAVYSLLDIILFDEQVDK